MTSPAARSLTEEEVATIVMGLTMLLNENAADAAKTAIGTPQPAEQELAAITARQQEVVSRLLSELEAGPVVTFEAA